MIGERYNNLPLMLEIRGIAWVVFFIKAHHLAPLFYLFNQSNAS